MHYNIAVIGSAFDEHHHHQLRTAAAAADCTIRFFPDTNAALSHMEDIHILFAPSDAQSPILAAAAPNLKWFASYYAGVDPLLKSKALRPGTLLTNGSGAYGVTIAEHMVMVTLMMLRRYAEYQRFVQEKQFRSDLMIGSIYGSTILICGTGDIGCKFAQRLQPFCPKKIIGVNRSGRMAEGFDEIYPIHQLDEVLPQADILALTLPGTPETDDLISARRIARMKEGAYLINVGRGNCVDQDALIDALHSGKLAGAALDVFRQEPVPENDPAWNTPNLLFTPHCSGKMTMAYTRDTLVNNFCENLQRFHDGLPLNHLVDPELGY